MSQFDTIEHKGTIKQILGTKIIVEVKTVSACSGCHAKSVCNMSSSSTNTIEIDEDCNNFCEGENVNVILTKALGFKALFLGYLLPFLILVATLIICSILTNNELLSGIVSLAVLIPYYGILFLNKSKLDQSFNFKIEKLNNYNE